MDFMPASVGLLNKTLDWFPLRRRSVDEVVWAEADAQVGEGVKVTV